MGFQIHNKEGISLTILQLDAEVAEFWNKPIHDKNYATPKKHATSINWFDNIGYNIHSPHVNYTSGWNNVKCSLLSVQTAEYGMLDVETQLRKLVFANEYLKPYFELIDYWNSLGYIPVKID